MPSYFDNRRRRNPASAQTPVAQAYQQEKQATTQVDQQAQTQDYMVDAATNQEAFNKSQEAEAKRVAAQSRANTTAAKRAGVKTTVDETGVENIDRNPETGKPVWESGFTDKPKATDKGTFEVPFRDPSGSVWQVPLDKINRSKDPTGTEIDEFDIPDANGQPQRIRRPVSATSPLFKVDPATGRRYTEAEDPTTGSMVQQPLGIDPAAASAAAINRRKEAYAAQKEQDSFQAESIQKDQNVIESSDFKPAKEKLLAAQRALKKLNTGPVWANDPKRGPVQLKSATEDIAYGMPADGDPTLVAQADAYFKTKKQYEHTLAQMRAEHDPIKAKLDEMAAQKDILAKKAFHDGHRLSIEIDDMEKAAKAGVPVYEPDWKKKFDAVKRDPRFTRIFTEAEHEATGSPLAADLAAATDQPELTTASKIFRDLQQADQDEHPLDGTGMFPVGQKPPEALRAPQPTMAEVLTNNLTASGPQKRIFPTNHPPVKNADGTGSNVVLGGFGIDGKEYVIPTMVDGKQLTEDQAVAIARKNGLDKYPSFATSKEADAWAQKNHGNIDERGYLKSDAGDPTAIAAKAFGIKDPENWTATPTARGDFTLTHAANGDSPIGFLDPTANRITLTREAALLNEHSRDILQTASADGMPVYVQGAKPPMPKAELAALISQGLDIGKTATTNDEAAIGLAKIGLSSTGIRERLLNGEISAQDARLLNERLSGHTEIKLDEASFRKGFQDHLANSDIDRAMFTSGDPERQRAAINHYADITFSKSNDNIALDRVRNQDLRQSLLAPIKDSTGTTVWNQAKQSVIPSIAMLAQTGRLPLDFLGVKTEAGALSREQWDNWTKRTGSYLDKVNARPEVEGAFNDYSAWASSAAPGEPVPAEIGAKIADVAFNTYHQLTPESAKDLDTSKDTFDIAKNPMLKAMSDRYLDTSDPAALKQLLGTLMLDQKDRDTSAKVQKYVERPRVATLADVVTRSQGLGLNLDAAKASAALDLGLKLDNSKDAKQTEAILTQASKVLGTKGLDETSYAMSLLTTQASDDQNGATALWRGGWSAGYHEVATEVVSSAAEAALIGLSGATATPEVVALRAARLAGKRGLRASVGRWTAAKGAAIAEDYPRMAAARQRLGASIRKEADAFQAAGITKPKFGKPLTATQKAKNLVVGTGKAAAAAMPIETVEEGFTSFGEVDPTFEATMEQMGQGALGAVFLTPIFAGGNVAVQAVRQRSYDAAYMERQKKSTDDFNRNMASVPGFKPITPADLEAAQGIMSNPAHGAALDEFHAALQEHAAAMAEPIAPPLPADAPAPIQQEATPANAATTTTTQAAEPEPTGQAAAQTGVQAPAPVGSQQAPSEQDAGTDLEGEVAPADPLKPDSEQNVALEDMPFSAPAATQGAPSPRVLAAEQRVQAATRRLAEVSSDSFAAMDELRALPPAERPLYTAAAKIAAGATDYTEAEAKAVIALNGSSAAQFQRLAPPLPAGVAGPRQLKSLADLPDVTPAGPNRYRLPEGVRITLPDTVIASLMERAPPLGTLLQTGAQTTLATQKASTVGEQQSQPVQNKITPAQKAAFDSLGDALHNKLSRQNAAAADFTPQEQRAVNAALPNESPFNPTLQTTQTNIPQDEQPAKRNEIQTIAHEATAAFLKANPNTAKLVRFSFYVEHDGGMQVGDMDGKPFIKININRLAYGIWRDGQDAKGLTRKQAADKATETLLHEIEHIADLAAAKEIHAKQTPEQREKVVATYRARLSPDKAKEFTETGFTGWRTAYYSNMWLDFTDEQRKSMVASYGTALLERPDWIKGMEGSRMAVTLKNFGSISEAVILHIREFLKAIKELVTNPSAAFAKHIAEVEKALAELLGDAPKSSTQFTLKPADAKPVIDFAASIPDAELATDVPEAAGNAREDEPHITVLYGLTEHEAEPVQQAIANHGPVTVTLGKVSVFENEKYDVLKVEVSGDSLHALNKKVSALPNANTFPDYKPHMTIAYLKKGEGKKYVGNKTFEGKTLTFDSVTFSPPEKMRGELGKPELPLTAQPTKVSIQVEKNKVKERRVLQFGSQEDAEAFAMAEKINKLATGNVPDAEIEKLQQEITAYAKKVADRLTADGTPTTWQDVLGIKHDTKDATEGMLTNYAGRVRSQAIAGNIYEPFTPQSFANAVKHKPTAEKPTGPQNKPGRTTWFDPTRTSNRVDDGQGLISKIKRVSPGGIGVPTTSNEWKWFRALALDAASSPLKPSQARAAAEKGEVEDPAAALWWLLDNLIGWPNGAPTSQLDVPQDYKDAITGKFAEPQVAGGGFGELSDMLRDDETTDIPAVDLGDAILENLRWSLDPKNRPQTLDDVGEAQGEDAMQKEAAAEEEAARTGRTVEEIMAEPMRQPKPRTAEPSAVAPTAEIEDDEPLSNLLDPNPKPAPQQGTGVEVWNALPKLKPGKHTLPSGADLDSLPAFSMSGNKAALLRNYLLPFLTRLAKGANRFVDLFGGTGMYTHALAEAGVLPKGSILNEWEWHRALTHKWTQQDHQAVAAHMGEYVARRDERLNQYDSFDSKRDAWMVLAAEFLNEQVDPNQTLQQTEWDNYRRVPLKDEPKSAAMYLVVQGLAFGNRTLEVNREGVIEAGDLVSAPSLGRAVWMEGTDVGGTPRNATKGMLAGFITDEGLSAPMRVHAPLNTLRQASRRLQGVEIRGPWDADTHGDALQVLRQIVKDGDLVSYDPPYLENIVTGASLGYGEGSAQFTKIQGALRLINDAVQPASDRGAMVVSTNNFHPALSARLSALGWENVGAYRAETTDLQDSELISFSHPILANDAASMQQPGKHDWATDAAGNGNQGRPARDNASSTERLAAGTEGQAAADVEGREGQAAATGQPAVRPAGESAERSGSFGGLASAPARNSRGDEIPLHTVPPLEPMHHGTRGQMRPITAESVLYMTRDPAEAQSFADGNIPGTVRGQTGDPRVVTLYPPDAGSVANISAQVDEALVDGDIDEVVTAAFMAGREKGEHDWLSFTHPSSQRDGSFQAYIPLYPETLLASAPARDTPTTLVEPGFYSQLREAIAAKMPARSNRATLKGIIANSDVNTDSLEASGVLPWIDQQPEPITREQMFEHLDDDETRRSARPATTHVMPDGYELTGPGMHTLMSAPAATRAYHGTPHKVDKFSTEKIGTGEGAQAYGWGLYFAQNQDVAAEYRDALSQGKDAVSADGRMRLPKYIYNRFQHAKEAGPSRPGWEIEAIKNERADFARRIKLAEAERKDALQPWLVDSNIQNQQDVIDAIDAYASGTEFTPPGNLYTVELLGDQDAFLDWDKPWVDQSEKVKAAFERAYPGSSKYSENSYGGAIYLVATRRFDAQRTSELLAQEGILGIRYLDGSSRVYQAVQNPRDKLWSVSYGAANATSRIFDTKEKADAFVATLQTHNFVIFDDKLVKILEENGRPAEQSGLLASAPASDRTPALEAALAQMPEAWREVLQATWAGQSVAEIASKPTPSGLTLSEVAVTNILRSAKGRLDVLMAAQDGTLKAAAKVINDPWPGEQPVQFTQGRPDLALGAEPAFAAVDRFREAPEVVTHDEMNELADRMFAIDPIMAEKMVVRWMDSGTQVIESEGLSPAMQSIMTEANARKAAPMLMTAAAKMLTTRSALKGGNPIQTARLIHAYRNTGTEQARALGMRRDPFKSPAERHAFFIAEAIYTPPENIRNEIRDNPENKDKLLAAWAIEADKLKEKLKAKGYDIDAAFAALNRKLEAERAADREVIQAEFEAIPEQIAVPLATTDPQTKALVKAILEGQATPRQAATLAGMTLEAAKAAFGAFRAKVNAAGVAAAEGIKRALLGAAPVADYASQIGIPFEDIFDEPDTIPVKTETTLKITAAREKKAKTIDAAIRQDTIPLEGELDLTNERQVAQIARDFSAAKSTFSDKMLEFWRASILSGPQTQTVNFTSSFLYGFYETTFKKLGAGALADAARMFGMKPDAASLADVPAMAAAVIPALQQAFKDAIRAWQTQSKVFNPFAENRPKQLGFGGVKAEEGFKPALSGPVGTIMHGISFRLMLLADEFVKSFYGRIEVAQQARQIARSENLKGQAFADRILELMQPGSRAWIKALDQSLKIGFQTELGTGIATIDQIDHFATWLKGARHGPNWLKNASMFVLPFIDTPTNLFKQGMTLSPMGTFLALADGARALRHHAKGNHELARKLYNATRLFDDAINQTVAWGATLAIAALIKPDGDDDKLPFITGTMPWRSTSRSERDNAYRTAPPQSIRIGGRWYSYARIDPFASALALTADSVEEFYRGDSLNTIIPKIGRRGLDNLQDKTFLQGISDVMNAIESPERFGTRWVTNLATGFIPNLIRQPIRSADDNLRNTDIPKNVGFWDAVEKRLGYSVRPQSAPLAINVYGEPGVKNTSTGGPNTDLLLRLLSPVQSQLANARPLDVKIHAYNSSHEKPLSLIVPDSRIERPSLKLKIDLTSNEHTELAVKVGRMFTAALGTAYDGPGQLTEQQAKQIVDIHQRVKAANEEILVRQRMATPR